MSTILNPLAWQRLIAVPHRAYFTAGVTAVLLLALWWSVALPLAGVTAQPSPLVHGLMMPLGIFPPFMLGFVFTAGPRWLGTTAPSGHFPLAVGQVLGLTATLAGFSVGGYWALPGLLALLIVWWWATWLWFSCMQNAPGADQRHARCILSAMMAGNVSLLLVAAWVISADAGIWLFARDLIVWGWIVPIFLTVAHRMVPFFTQAVVPQRQIWRPEWALYGWLGCCAVLILGGLLELPYLTALAAVILSASTGYVAWQWAGGKIRGACGGNRLLAMLHLSFAWLPLAFALQALGAVGVPVGTAALHAVGMGFCLTMMVGFVTRVTLGHSGRPLQASNSYWYLYLALHGLTVARVLLAVFGAFVSPHLLHLVAMLWLGVLGAWACHVLPVYWQPRADGQPG